MTDRWHVTRALVGLPGMPNSPRPIRLHGVKRGWQTREVKWGARTRLEWLESSLPAETQVALRHARGEAPEQSSLPAPEAEGGEVTAPPSVILDERAAAQVDARLEIVTAFEAWHTKRPGPVVPALKSWVRLYASGLVEISEATRTATPRLAWNTLQRWRAAFRKNGSLALLPGAGGRSSGIVAEPELRDCVEALIRANPRHITANNIRRALAAKFPERSRPAFTPSAGTGAPGRPRTPSTSRPTLRTPTAPARCRPSATPPRTRLRSTRSGNSIPPAST